MRCLDPALLVAPFPVRRGRLTRRRPRRATGDIRIAVESSVPGVGVGDAITVKIVEAEQISPEDERPRPDSDDTRSQAEEISQGPRMDEGGPDT